MIIRIVLHQQGLQIIRISTILRIIPSIDSHTEIDKLILIPLTRIFLNFVDLIQMGMLPEVQVMVGRQVRDLLVFDCLEEIVFC